MKKLAASLLVFLVLSNTTFGRGFGGHRIFQRRRQQSVPHVYAPPYSQGVQNCFIKACAIEYVSDDKDNDYWQCPAETAERKKGDCEDMAFYLFDLLQKKGYSSRVVMGFENDDHECGHALVEYTYAQEIFILDPAYKKLFKRSELDNQVPRTDYVEFS